MVRKVIRVLIILCFVPPLWAGQSNYARMTQLYEARQFTEVEAIANKILRNKKTDEEQMAEALFYLTAVRVFKGNYKAAIPYMIRFEKAHKRLAKKRWDEERKKLKKRPKNNTVYFYVDARFVGLYYELGKYHVQYQRYNQAYDWLLMAKSSSKLYKDPIFNFYLGLTNTKLGHYSEARKYYKRQLSVAPDEPSPYYNIACSYSLEGDTKNAVIWLKRAIKAKPKYRIEARSDKDFANIRDKKEFKSLVWGRQ